MRAAVIGHPINHSLSPLLFKFLAKKFKFELEYLALDVPPSDINDKFRELEKTHVGINVTIPHKENILNFADTLSEDVTAVGAANVLHFKNEKSYAYNTDVKGIKATLEKNGISLSGQSVFVVGSGGAARALVCAAAQGGSKNIYIFSRNHNHSKSLIRHMTPIFTKCEFIHCKEPVDKILETIHLVVNATPLGMAGFDDGLIFFSKVFSFFKTSPTYAFDLIYRPEITTFLEAALKKGAITFGGLDMFIYQALATWNIWFGEREFSSEVIESLRFELKRVLNA